MDNRKINISEQLEEALILANKIKIVQEDKHLTKKVKKVKLKQIIKTNKKTFLNLVFIFLQNNLWTKRSWAVRLALIGGVLPVLALGGKSVGVATMGWGIGIPIFLITSAGSSFIGLVIDNITLKQKLKKSSKNLK